MEDIWSTTNPLRAGDWENVTFRIKNQGSSSVSTKFYTRMWINDNPVATWSTASLCAGCSATGATMIKLSADGDVAIKVEVDNTKVVPESNEGNNIRTETWRWAPPAQVVDLVVEDIWSTTNPLRVGGWENVTFRIKNRGSSSASTKFYTKMWVDDTYIATWSTASLCAGCCRGLGQRQSDQPGLSQCQRAGRCDRHGL